MKEQSVAQQGLRQRQESRWTDDADFSYLKCADNVHELMIKDTPLAIQGSLDPPADPAILPVRADDPSEVLHRHLCAPRRAESASSPLCQRRSDILLA